MNNKRTFVRSAGMLGLSLLTASCFHDSSNNLKLTFLDSLTGKPLAGITVVLHNADRVTYRAENVKTSGSDGIVRFDDLDKSRVTYTVIQETGSADYTLETAVDFPATPTVVRLYQSNDELPDCDISVNIAVTGIPAGADSLQGSAPWWWYGSFLGGGHGGLNNPLPSTVETSESVCADDIQSDGKISLLAKALDETDQVLRYGFVVDQALADGASYTVNLDRNPQPVPWATSPDWSVDYLGVYGIRKGVTHILGASSSFFGGTDTLGSSGTVHLAAEFPHDFAYLFAAADKGATEYWHMNPLDAVTPDTTLNIAFDTDLDVGSLEFDSSAARYSWSTTGHGDITFLDLYAVKMTAGPVVQYQSIEWHVTMPPDVTEWKIPDLPISIDARQLVIDDNEAGVTSTDYGALDGFGDIVALIIETADGENRTLADTFGQLGTITSVSTELAGTAAARTAQRRNRAIQPDGSNPPRGRPFSRLFR